MTRWLLLALLCACDRPEPDPEPTTPLVIDVERDLHTTPTVVFASMAIHPEGHTLYLGRYGSYDAQRMDLFAVRLGPELETTRHAVSLRALPAGASVSVNTIVVSRDGTRLYLALAPIAGDTARVTERLAVVTLEKGRPVDTHTFDGPLESFLPYTMALSHDGARLYIGGFGSTELYVQPLSEGLPEGPMRAMSLAVPVIPNQAELLLHPQRPLLYVGGDGQLETLALSDDGLSATRVGLLKLDPEDDLAPVRLAFAGEHLARRSPSYPAGPITTSRFGWIDLLDGLPVVYRPDTTPVLDVASADSLLAVARRPFFDAVTGAPIESDLALLSGDTATELAHYPHTHVLFLGLAGTRPVLVTSRRPVEGNRHADLRMRVRLDRVRGDGNTWPVTLGVIGTDFYAAAELAVGETSPWFEMDPALRDFAGQRAAMVSVAGGDEVAVTFEVALGDPDAGGVKIATVSSSSAGDDVLVRLPGLAHTGDLAALVQTEHEATLAHLEHARAVGLAKPDRPRLFPVGCYSIIGGEARAETLDTHAELVARLGCNMIQPIGWEDLPEGVLSRSLENQDIVFRAASSYTPPAYFDFDALPGGVMTDEALSTWADETIDYALSEGASEDSLRHVVIADEPAWYYPTMLDYVANDPARLVHFQTFLQRQGLAPDELGLSTWDEARPAGKPLDTSALTRHERARIYWTLRYFSTSASEGFRMAAKAIRARVGRDVPVHVNWNNWGLNAWHYNAWPGRYENNPADVGPARGTGSEDWFYAGRTEAHDLYTEDWVPDAFAELWSYRLDTLRSAARGADIAAYIIPNAAGQMRDGLSYKLLSLVGRGGKLVSYFNYGPSTLQSDGWSDQLVLYEALSRAHRRLARAEHILFEASPERARVAILTPFQSLFFDETSETDYTFECEHLHRALTHAGYRIDLIDPVAIAAGELETLGYVALFATSPNLPAAARDALKTWVAAGGTLVTMPHALTTDEYDDPIGDLDEVLGLEPRLRTRAPLVPPYEERPGPWWPANAALEGGQPIRGTIAAMTPTEASVDLRFEGGAPALSAHPHGLGMAYTFAFWPGMQHAIATQREYTDRFATNDGAIERDLITRVLPETARPSTRVDKDHIEVLRLDGPAGIGLILLDWGNGARTSLKLSIEDVGPVRSVESVEGAALTFTQSGARLDVDLDTFEAIDILLIERP